MMLKVINFDFLLGLTTEPKEAFKKSFQKLTDAQWSVVGSQFINVVMVGLNAIVFYVVWYSNYGLIFRKASDL